MMPGEEKPHTTGRAARRSGGRDAAAIAAARALLWSGRLEREDVLDVVADRILKAVHASDVRGGHLTLVPAPAPIPTRARRWRADPAPVVVRATQRRQVPTLVS